MATLAAVFVLNYWLKEFLLSTFVNRFDLRCQSKQLMPLYYKLCPSCYHGCELFNDLRKAYEAGAERLGLCSIMDRQLSNVCCPTGQQHHLADDVGMLVYLNISVTSWSRGGSILCFQYSALESSLKGAYLRKRVELLTKNF